MSRRTARPPDARAGPLGAGPGSGGRAVDWVLSLCLAVSLGLALAYHLPRLGQRFSYLHCHTSAHFAIMARSFATHGVLGLGLVPVQNNPPLGVERDAYVHWPPLFPIVLSLVFRAVGVSEAAAHGFALTLVVANAAALYALVRLCAGGRAAAVAASAFLWLPSTMKFGLLVVHLHLALLGMLLAFCCYVRATRDDGPGGARRWAIVGSALMFLACATSWEPVLLCAGLLVVAVVGRRRRALGHALLYCVASGAAFGAVLTVYVVREPHRFAHLWAKVRSYSTGARVTSGFNVHTLWDVRYFRVLPEEALHKRVGLFVRRLNGAGQFAAAAVAAVVVAGLLSLRQRLRTREALLFAGLFAPWWLWFLTMSVHTRVHQYDDLIMAPGCAAAIGVATAWLLESVWASGARRAAQWALLAAVPGALVLPAAIDAADAVRARRRPRDDPQIAVALEIKAATEPGAVVLVPLETFQPVFYSERHIIRYVVDDAVARKVVAALPQVLPGAPAYLAVPAGCEEHFTESIQQYAVVKRTPHLLLLRVPRPTTGGALGEGG